MEAGQIEKKVTWLDEQRRKDVASLEKVGARLDEMDTELRSRAEQLKNISSDLTRLTALATRVNQFDDSLHKHRQEVSRHVDDLEKQRTDREKHQEQLRKSDHEDLQRRLDGLNAQLDELSDMRAAMEARKDEEVRQSREMDGFKKKLDDLAERAQDNLRAVSAAEDARKTEARRVSDLQSETSALREKLDATGGTMDIVEDRVRRIETHLAEIDTAEADRRDSLTAWSENQERRLVDFERGWREWDAHFQAFEAQAKDLDERMKTYEETYRGIKQLQKELESVVERLDRRINEITEMQRLAEDRSKQDWAAFKADDQKRWNTYKLTGDEQWREHGRIHDKLSKQLDSIQGSLKALEGSVKSLTDSRERQILDLLGVLREWAAELEARQEG
jgi:chromosome segregation ATPase